MLLTSQTVIVKYFCSMDTINATNLYISLDIICEIYKFPFCMIITSSNLDNI